MVGKVVKKTVRTESCIGVCVCVGGGNKNFDSEDKYISKYMFVLHFEDFEFESEGARRGFGVSSLKGTRKGANHCALVVNEFHQVQALFLLQSL